MRARVLVVDDEEDLLELVTFHIQSAGWEAVTATNAADALERIAASRPDLILLDLMLPDLDGLSLCEMFRRSPQTAAIPILMLTGLSREPTRQLALQVGADDFITKPFSPRELMQRVTRVIEGRGPRGTGLTGPLISN